MRSLVLGYEVDVPLDVCLFSCEVCRHLYFDNSYKVSTVHVVGRKLEGIVYDCVIVKSFSLADMDKALDLVDELNAFIDARREQDVD